MKPLVSVIIPVYNVENYLRQCLDTVINQTLQEIEIICINDGSTDNSLKILEEYAKKDNRIIILSQENKGSGPTLNNGISKSTGEFIAIMDSDDYYPSSYVLEYLYKIAKKTNVLVCGGSAIQLKNDILITDFNKFDSGYSFRKSGFHEYIDYQYDYGYWRFIYNREFLLKNNLYFEDYRRYKDPIWFIKTMTLAKYFYAIKLPVYVYRVEHKEIEWTIKKVRDCICGITDVLNFSNKYNLEKLHYKYATKRLYDNWLIDNVFSLLPENDEALLKMLKAVNLDLIHEFDPNYVLPKYEKK